MICADRPVRANQASFAVKDYDLAATLTSGQTFRWRRVTGGWEAVVAQRWVRLATTEPGCAALPPGSPTPHSMPDSPSLTTSVIHARTAAPADDWQWLADYLRVEEDLAAVVAAFPDDPPLRAAVRDCAGLRLLRQEPWECLASFILSSTKQIVQIQQIIEALCARFGEPVAVPPGAEPAFGFPSPTRLAAADESELRACKMGFRAPYLLATARQVAEGKADLARLGCLPLAAAREHLVRLPGVGPKIADCVLLFAYGFQAAFPVDVWVMKALRQLYFPRRSVSLKRLRRFSDTHFGPQAGYAQQYLFHYMRTKPRTDT